MRESSLFREIWAIERVVYPIDATRLWCVAKKNAVDSSLQTAIEWACGQSGADCGPIQQGGPCNDPTDVQKMASFVSTIIL
ncbi:X8 domain [Arabidopsis thaliana x Arabidopsis arenosa]|uniref:X8 domain n=1 Tax=Arabidopsis thaliana x Arabidopsis arenosa TaxID=1240361 RepID=A0A8T1XLW6_9BRAS|nr:X8 domain [Arabidopsis thaliana x Arabidopsis arenosa]